MNAVRHRRGRKLMWIGALVLLCGSARAQWLPLEGNDDLEVYVDLSTRIHEEGTVKVMALFNYRKPGYAHGRRYWSSLMQDEYDCVAERRRRLFLSAHSEPMAEGRIVLRNASPGEWRPVFADSVGERLWKAACQGLPASARKEQMVDSTRNATSAPAPIGQARP